MRLCRAVGDTLRHRVRFRPDDVTPQIPAVRLYRQGEPPRDAAEVFLFEVYRDTGSPALVSICAPVIVSVIAAISGRIRIAEVNPGATIIPQHPPALTHHGAQLADEAQPAIVAGRPALAVVDGFEAELVVNADCAAFYTARSIATRNTFRKHSFVICIWVIDGVVTLRTAALPFSGAVIAKGPVLSMAEKCISLKLTYPPKG